MADQYTPEELESLRRQLREGNEMAKAAVLAAGVTLHPRIAEARKKPTPEWPPGDNPDQER